MSDKYLAEGRLRAKLTDEQIADVEEVLRAALKQEIMLVQERRGGAERTLIVKVRA